jgi:hypothetical protein
MGQYDNATEIGDIAGADQIDSRDLDELLTELERRDDDATVAADEGEEAIDPLEDTERELMEALRELRDEVGDEWRYGAQLIAEHYFTDYAKEFATDIGAISGDEEWPANKIDWKAAADELKQDFTSSEFGGTTYYYHA